MFWGEQPPFIPFGCGGRYFFGVMTFSAARPEPSRRRRGCSLPAISVAFLLGLLALFGLYRCETFPGRAAEQAASALERIGRDARDQFVQLAHLQPRVTINNRVYLEQTRTVAQLAVLERRVEVEHEMLHSWAGSTKRIKLHGTFLVKAGFDLGQKFTVNVTPVEVLLELPHAKILSVEQVKVDVLSFENGLWNRISPNDIERELAALPGLAREKSAALPAEAERVFTGQFLEKFHPSQPVRAIFPAPRPAG